MILTTQSEKVNNRMEGVTIDTPKEKLGTPGFLKSIGSIFSKLSPKQFKRAPKLPQPTDAIQVDRSQPSSEEEEDEEEEEEEDEEEEEEEDENRKNLNNRSSEEQREDWAQTKGKALARTPIQPKRLYPNLEEVEEDEQRLGADLRADSEDGDDESVDEAGPSKPVRRNRNLRVKGQPPTRISTRIRGEPPAPLENEHIEINVLVNQTETVINEQDNLSKINELSSAKSSDSESDEEEITVNRKNLTKRVKQKEKVETRPTSDSEEEQVTVKITNPRKKVEQKGKVEENKKTKVRSITPDRLRETNTLRKVEQKGKVETNKKTKVRPITPDRLSETNPLRDIELWETTTTFPKMKEEDETVIIKRKSVTSHQSHFDKMYRYLRNAGVPKEEAKHGALMASEPLNDEALCDSEVESEETILAKDCRVKSNQSYYNSQKLLQNQQQMTISLLAQVPAFNGMGSTKFEDWIKHFERVIDTSEFEEGKKIKLLYSKLFGSAEDCITTFQLCYPKEAKSFTKVKQCLHERFHGGDSRKMYLTEYNNCTRNPGESIRDYACRIQKLYSFAYPTKAGKSVDLEMRELMIMDRFLGGLKSNLRERMSFKEFKNLKDLVKATENCAAILNEAKLEKRNVEFINAISTNSNSQALSEIKKEAEGWKMASEKNQKLLSDLLQKKVEKKQKKREEGFINAVSTNSNVQAMDDTKRDLEELKITAKNNQKLLSDMMQQARETTKLMNQVSQLQAQAVVPNQSVFPPQNQNNQQSQNHSNQFVERNTQGPQPPPKYGSQPNNQANRYPPREAKYCSYCAKTNASNPVTHNTEMCGFGPQGPTCFKCKQTGHLARDCPQTQNTQNGIYRPPGQNTAGQLNPWNRGN
jgi:hypothetical protein